MPEEFELVEIAGEPELTLKDILKTIEIYEEAISTKQAELVRVDANYGMMDHANFDELVNYFEEYGKWKTIPYASFDEFISVSAETVEQQEIIAQLKADILDLKKEAREEFGTIL